jgi:DNA-binding CsgD family transcriptional regulator/PAS domain-containing protein
MASAQALFSARVGALYGAALDPARWPDAVTGIADEIGAGTGACLLVERAPRDYALALPVRLDPAAALRYLAHYAPLDPLGPVLRAHPPGTLVHSEVELTAAERSRSEFCVDYTAPHDMRECLAVVLGRESGASVTLQCVAPFGAPAFGPAARQAVSLLGPHVRRAVQVAERLGTLGSDREGVRRPIDHLADPVLVTDAQGRVAYANRAGEALLHLGDALATERAPLGARGGLRAARPDVTAALRQAIATAAAAGAAPPASVAEEAILGRGTRVPGGILTLPRPGRAPLTLFVAPLRASTEHPLTATVHPWQTVGGSTGRSGVGRPAAVLVVCGGASDVPLAETPDLGSVQTAYRLTRAEAEVAVLVAQGRSVREIAAARGVAVGTVRNQLKQVFAKTGVRRQAALVRVLADGERGGRGSRHSGSP